MMFNVKASKQKLSKALYATIESVQFHLDLETHRDDRMIATVIDDCLDNELDDSKSDHSNMSESPAIKNATRTSNTNLDNQSLVSSDISVNSSHDNVSSSDTNTDSDLSDDDDCKHMFPPFGSNLHPKFVEFTNVFPAYPKTHSEGVAHVIKLSPELLKDEKELNKFRTSLQYSMTKGHGVRIKSDVPFFSVDGESVPINYFVRQCAGMTVSVYHIILIF